MPDLARSEWASDMACLSLDCAGSSAEDAKKRTRTLWSLLVQAPQPSLLHGLSLPHPGRMQALLAADACDTAVLEILGPEVEYALSRKPHEDHVASLTLSDGEEASSPGASPALAVIGALALALSNRASKP